MREKLSLGFWEIEAENLVSDDSVQSLTLKLTVVPTVVTMHGWAEIQRTPHDQDGRLLHLSYLPFFASVTQKSFLKQVPLGGAAPLLFLKKMIRSRFVDLA